MLCSSELFNIQSLKRQSLRVYHVPVQWTPMLCLLNMPLVLETALAFRFVCHWIVQDGQLTQGGQQGKQPFLRIFELDPKRGAYSPSGEAAMRLRTQELSMAMVIMRRTAGHTEKQRQETGRKTCQLSLFLDSSYNPDPAKARFFNISWDSLFSLN